MTKYYEVQYGRWAGLVEKTRYYKHADNKIVYIEFTTKTKSKRTRVEVGTISQMTFSAYKNSCTEITYSKFNSAMKKGIKMLFSFAAVTA